MPTRMFTYTKSILERVSFDPILFFKEFEKALKVLLPYEVDQLKKWVLQFTEKRPELQDCLILIEK